MSIYNITAELPTNHAAAHRHDRYIELAFILGTTYAVSMTFRGL